MRTSNKIKLTLDVKISTVKPVTKKVKTKSVYCSTDYDLLVPFEYNRYSGKGCPVLEAQTKEFEQRLKATKKMLSENGFNPSTPILCGIVDNHFMIVEGHNRYIAAHELNIPFYFEVDEELNTIEKVSSVCFRINNTGTKWSAMDKVIYASVDPTFEVEQREKAAKIVSLISKYKISPSTVIYIASNGSGHSANTLSKKSFKVLDDTDDILNLIKKINSKSEFNLDKKDKFMEAVMLVYRASKNKELTAKNLINRAHTFKNLTKDLNTRLFWNNDVQSAANYNLSSGKNSVTI